MAKAVTKKAPAKKKNAPKKSPAKKKAPKKVASAPLVALQASTVSEIKTLSVTPGREIEPEMVAWLDKRLEKNPIFQKALAEKDAREIYALANEACVGIREVGGNNRGPMVVLMQKTIGGAGREAWCMSGQQTCIAYAELKTGIKSPIYPSEHCQTVWRKTPKAQRVKLIPMRGALGIWGDIGKDTGHCCMIRSADQKRWLAVEMNTESGVDKNGDLNRDGGGCYLTERSTAATKKRKILGALKPF